jgi:hypothetical protein
MRTLKNLDIQIKAMLIFTIIVGGLFTAMILVNGFNSF